MDLEGSPGSERTPCESFFIRIVAPAFVCNKTAAALLTRYKVLPQSIVCCGEGISVSPVSKRRCQCCRRMVNQRQGTVFEQRRFRKLDYKKLVILLWRLSSPNYSNTDIAAETGMDPKTVSEIVSFISSKIKVWMDSSDRRLLGGHNETVELDETTIGHRKHNRGREKRKEVVFGVVERSSGRTLTAVVPNVQKTTLVPIILRHVKRGSRIFSDGLSTYKKLNETYDHLYVNHSRTYVLPMDNVIIHYTNRIEGAWHWFKRTIKGRRNIEDACTFFDFRNHVAGTFSSPDAKLRSTFIALMKVLKGMKSE